ncbi:MAG TPA: SpoIID/LytB domain-containing protein [Pyrinomonadaceae bacterium]|jgi:stage II sporulation protein D
MRRSLWSKAITLVVAHALVASTLAQDASQQTRPRRTQTITPPTSSAPVIASQTRLASDPVVRIGLTTSARSVNISTNGRLLNASDESAPLVPLNVARVRLEARWLTPQAAPASEETFRVEIARAASRADAERAAREIKELTREDSEVTYDAASATWRLRVGSGLTASEADDLRAQLESAGFASTLVSDTLSNASTVRSAQSSAPKTTDTTSIARPPTSSTVRPVARTGSAPSRELVAYSAGSQMLFSSRAPVVFASDDERNAPVRLNDKPYRGRLEVFPNAKGALTVVNVIGLEDYVLGVVPNELSPGGYPAIEALKAQAVAARTYAMKNRGQFARDGFDLLPTTRSQVYGGFSTEHPLTTRAVIETRGIIATYHNEPINALYTSTCGGRTENAENIFNEASPYLRGRECSLEGRAHFSPFTIKTSREPADIREEANAQLARDAAILDIHDFDNLSRRMTDAWLSSPVTLAELRSWLSATTRFTRQPLPLLSEEATRPPGFSTALAAAVYGEARADTLLDNADVEYLLAFRDAGEIPQKNRADVALLLRDGYLALYADATLRPREALTRARALHTIARLLESRNLLQLQKGTTKPTTGGAFVLRSSKGREQPLRVSDDAYLFRSFGDAAYQMRQLAIVGGEPATFHVNAQGLVDYVEVRPAPNGAASDRFSPFANWTTNLSVGEVQSRLARWSRGVGALTDLRVAARGSSRRAIDLEIIGTNGTAHLRGGRIRSALGLREQLFVIDRRYDDAGRLIGFTFTGRGWGHGVGMCQVGAYGLARAGLSYDKILKAYYTGIELTKMY